MDTIMQVTKIEKKAMYPKHGHPPHPSNVIKTIRYTDIQGAKVVFINMPLRETAVPNVLPQGPLLLATNLRDNYGVHSSIIDLNAYRIKDALALKRNLPNGRHLTYDEAFQLIGKHFKVYGVPDVIAFSGMITTLRWQEQIAIGIRQMLPDVFLVSGNGLATELRLGLFQYIPQLDAVAHSEGDDVIIKIVYDAVTIKKMGLANASNSGKLNPYCLGEFDGRVRFLYEGNRPLDLDKVPFADPDFIAEDINGNRLLEYYLGNPIWGIDANNSSAAPFQMTRSTSFVSSRGCPYACSFCFRGSQGERNYGVRSASNIVDEFKLHIEKYVVDFIGMPDDNFGVSAKRIADLVPLLKPLGMRWGTHMRLDESAGLRPDTRRGAGYLFEDPKRVDLMAEAGCVYIGFGAESASSRTLEAMNKGGFILTNGLVSVNVNGRTFNFPRTMIEGIRNCEYAGIHANCTWIMGYPTEILNDLKATVAFIKWQEDFYRSCGKPSSSVNKNIFTATWYPGTEMIHHKKVRDVLSQVFGIRFDTKTGNLICDENLHKYISELDDATKLLHDPKTGVPLNFSDMSDETFVQARAFVDQGEIYNILEMKEEKAFLPV